MKKLILLSLVLVPGMAVAQSFSKWVDEDGQVHYGDRPPIDDKIYADPIYIKPGVDEKDEAYTDYYRRRSDSYDDYMQRRGEHQIEMDERRFEENQRRTEENQRRYEEAQRRQREREYDDYLRQKAVDEQIRKIEVRRRHSTGTR